MRRQADVWELPGGLARPGERRATAALVATMGVALAGAGVALAALVWALDGLPYQDVPNHLARAVIASDLLFDAGRRFGGAYTIHLAFTPYVLQDVVLASLVHLVGPYAAAKLLTIVVAASMPAAIAVYLRTLGHSRYVVLLGALLGLYLGTDWFFLMGFIAFRLALALVLLALAAWQRYLRTGSAASYAAYVACLAAGYLTHLSALLFIGAGAALTAALALRGRRTTLARAVAGGLPLVALGVWHLSTSAGAPAGPTIWDPAATKVRRLVSPFRRAGLGTDLGMLALLAAAGTLAAGGARRAWRSPRVAVPAALAVLFLALYAAMPVARAYIWYIDVRAVPLAVVFALVAALAAADVAGRRSAVAAVAAVALALANLALLHAHLSRANAENLAFRELALRVPEGANVLTIATRPKDRAVNPLLHAGLFATIERGAHTPYLFANGVTPYFHWERPLPAPNEFWYLLGTTPDVAAIAPAYDDVLLAKPYDPSRIPIRTRVVAENGTAALLAIVRPPDAPLAP